MTEKNDQNAVEDNWLPDDVFDRKSVADDFTKIITYLPSPYVVSINAGYGHGKTFFIDRWIKDLKASKHSVISFNAWESDYTTEPLVAFGTEFQEQLKNEKLIDDAILKGLGKTFLNIASQTMIAGVNIATLGIIDFEELNKKETEDTLEKYSGNIAAAKVETHLKIKNSISAFKEFLSKAIENLQTNKKDTSENLYVFIDELDRCRPSFAIEFLEIIKHFFNVSGIIFVIAMDQDQLQHAVKSVYGNGFDGQGYLRRFIDLELNLPEVKPNAFVNMLAQDSGIKNRNDQEQNIFIGTHALIQYYSEYADFFNLSLRDIQRGNNSIRISLSLLASEKQVFYPQVLGFLIAARQKSMGYYKQIGTSLGTYKKIINEAENVMNKPNKLCENESNHITLKHMLKAMLATNSDDIKSEYNGFLSVYNDKDKNNSLGIKDKKEKEFYERVVSLADKIDWNYNGYARKSPLFYLKEIIDIGSKY